MTTIRIWALESDYDAKAVECLANKLAKHLQLGNLSIQISGSDAFPQGGSLSGKLNKATQNYLEEDSCVIFVIDSDGPMSSHQRRKQTNSLINQIEGVVKDKSLAGRVFLVQAVQELEAWLLVDCLWIFCHFASQRAHYKENCRSRVSANRALRRLIGNKQKVTPKRLSSQKAAARGPKNT